MSFLIKVPATIVILIVTYPLIGVPVAILVVWLAYKFAVPLFTGEALPGAAPANQEVPDRPIAAPLPRAPFLPAPEPDFVPADFWVRAGATTIDALARLLLGALAFLAGAPDSVMLLLVFAYGVVLIGWRGQTLGQMAAGIVVVQADGSPVGLARALWRGVASLLALALLGSGHLMIAFTPGKRGLHDYLAGTRVIHLDPVVPARRAGMTAVGVCGLVALLASFREVVRRTGPVNPDLGPRGFSSDRAAPKAEPIEWVKVAAAGEAFMIGTDAGWRGFKDARPPHRVVFKEGFELSKAPVTVEQYAECYNGGKGPCTKPNTGWYCNWEEAPDKRHKKHPINCIDWDQAVRFAKFHGARLPSEAEFEYAARSGGKDQEYPWGDGGPSCDKVSGLACAGRGTRPVCSKPAGNARLGAGRELCDMTGNVAQFLQDAYRPGYAGAPGDGTAAAGPGAERVIRGGTFLDFRVRYFHSSYRRPFPGTSRMGLAGFRLARSLRDGAALAKEHHQSALAWAKTDLAKAAASWESAVALDPSQPTYRFNLGLAYWSLDEKIKALPHLRRYLELVPSGPSSDLVREKLRSVGAQ